MPERTGAGFGSRLKDAMLAAGIRTSVELGAKVGVPRQTAARWLVMKEPELSGVHLLALSSLLNVRAHWLGEGTGVLGRRIGPDMERAADLLDRLTRPQCGKWFKYGEKLLAGK